VLAPGAPVVPIVVAASLYDLGGEGDKAWGRDPPYRNLGMAAADAPSQEVALGRVGAGRGARAGLHPGGLGSASLVVDEGLVVGALAAVNPVGSVYEDDGVTPFAWPFEIDAEFGGRRPALDAAPTAPFPKHARIGVTPRPGAATTLCVVAVSAALTPAEAKRVAMMAQDGLARAIRPAHTAFDGDIVICVAEGKALPDGPDRARTVARLGAAATDTLARAIARGAVEGRKL